MKNNSPSGWEPPAKYNLNDDERRLAKQFRNFLVDLDDKLAVRYPNPVKTENKEFDRKGRAVFYKAHYEVARYFDVKEDFRDEWLKNLPKNSTRMEILQELTTIHKDIV